jgi:hypothetical protein
MRKSGADSLVRPALKAKIVLMKSLRQTQSGANVGDPTGTERFVDQTVETLFPRQGPARQSGAELTAEEIHSRASETGTLLEAILRTRGSSPRHDWGLNE